MPLVTRDRFDALLLDLDGTLLDGRGEVTPRTRAAVARVMDAGYLVLIATGRSRAGSADVHETLGLRSVLCAYNGAYIGPARGEEAPWHRAPIPEAMLPHVEAVERCARFPFRHHGERKFTSRILTDDHRRVAKWYRNVVEVDPETAALPREDLMRVSVFFDDHESTEGAWSALPEDARAGLHREVFPLSIFPDFADVGLFLCEVQRRGLGKAEAFRYLLDVHGISAERVVAVGDQRNDLSMLERAGLAVAMGNAVPDVLPHADVVIGPHHLEGLAAFLEGEVAGSA